MKLGIISDMRNPDGSKYHRPWVEHYNGFLDLVAELEELGYESVVFPEHHFEADGYIPNPIPMMTAVAMRTKKMLIGADLFRLPDWHPVRLAEDVSLVDILSNGRVLFKAGAGGLYPPVSDGLGWDPRRQSSRSTESMQIILKCWTEEVFDWEGRHYNLKGVRSMPKPVQKPHPPVFMPAMNPKSMERNAREGYGAAMAGGRWTLEREDLGWWKGWHAEWVEALARYGRTTKECPASVFMNFFCTDDPERAWAKHREGILYVTHAYAALRSEPLLPETPEELPHWDKVFLTPDQMVKLLRELFDGAPPDHLLLWDAVPGMSFQESYESHKMFVEQVWPKISGGLTGSL
ncbi:MAG TPA: LLM class flavin-dependent oxidoreductase [Dehalococcoidia bacterium]|nr:LLM class flavin-dependent oxidoreductase [Dehalococcoidia bacterium]